MNDDARPLERDRSDLTGKKAVVSWRMSESSGGEDSAIGPAPGSTFSRPRTGDVSPG